MMREVSLLMMWGADNTGGPKRPPVAPNINPQSAVVIPLTVPQCHRGTPPTLLCA